MVKYGKSRFRISRIGFSFQILVKCRLSATIAFAGKRSVFGYLDCNFGTLAFYLFGKITLPHDSPLTHISVGRLMFGLLVLTFDIFNSGLWEHR
jgi:thiol:disulfide interchange protein DsbD